MLALQPGISVDEALGAIFRACAARCAANHDAVLDSSDPEGVHQFRVALRRLRSALVAFKAVLPADDAAWLEGEAGRLIDLLGPARDWDVFITETLAAGSGGTAGGRRAEGSRRRRRGRAPSRPRAGGRAARAGLHLVPAPLRPLDRDRGLAQSGRAGRARVAAAAPGRALLDKRHRRVLKRGRDFERLSDSQLHRFRITLKKLRYAGEFFASQFPEGRLRPYIKALRRLQERPRPVQRRGCRRAAARGPARRPQREPRSIGVGAAR